MPYIENADRKRARLNPSSPGELNYALTCLVNYWIEFSGLNYRTISEVVGALECAKLEAYRRIAAPYEDRKIEANGDVYPRV